MIFSILLIFLSGTAAEQRVVGWYNGVPAIDKIPWDAYTHIRYGAPSFWSDGTPACNHTQMDKLVTTAHKYGVRVIWAPGIGFNPDFTTTQDVYFKGIKAAMDECDVDGIDVDYERGPNKWGVVTPAKANIYTEWLAYLRESSGRPVSADISLPGIAPGNWILGWLPWINVTALNGGAFDYVNTMSYHYNRLGDIWAWKKDVWFLTRLWGIDPARINLGIPYFSHPGSHTWGSLSEKCPNIAYDENYCAGEVIVGKKMNYEIGLYAKRHNIGGLFPWELSYDSYTHNNTLVRYAVRGLYNRY